MSKTVTETQTKENTRTIKSKKPAEDTGSVNSEAWDEAVSQSTSSLSLASAKNEIDETPQDDSKLHCGSCKKELTEGDIIIPCEICKKNFHIQCENVNKTIHKYIMDSKKPKSKTKIHWYCSSCNVITVDMMQHVSVLEDNQKKLQKRVSDLEIEVKKKLSKEDIKGLEDRVEQLEKGGNTKNEAKDTEGTSRKEPTTSEVVKEIKDQESRKCNIILHNVQEKQSDNEDERNKHDREQLKELGKVCKQTIKKEDVVMMRRLGKRNPNKPRPILVEFRDEEKKSGLMSNLVNLSKAPDALRKISVQHDLTKKQRDEEKLLREEAKKMEAEDDSGEFDYRIRGPPWARQIKKMKKKENK